jgi:hypothetical protein
MESKIPPEASVERTVSRDTETDFDDRRSSLSVDGYESAGNPKFYASAPAQLGPHRVAAPMSDSGEFNSSAHPLDDTYSALYQNSATTPQAHGGPPTGRSMVDSQRRSRAVFASPSATMPVSRPVQSASNANAAPNSMWFTMDDSAVSRPSHANLLPRSMSAGKQRPQVSRGQLSGPENARRRQIIGFAGGKIERWCIVLGPLTKVINLEYPINSHITSLH